MRKIGHIAAREFVATVMTRGFIVGLLIMPALITVFAIAGPRLFASGASGGGRLPSSIRPAWSPAGARALDPARSPHAAKDARLALALAPDGVRESPGRPRNARDDPGRFRISTWSNDRRR
jgi:hypothetical protein